LTSDASPSIKPDRRGKREEGRNTDHSDTVITSPFLGARGRLYQLGWWRGRRKPQ